jgi:hypothetical protein
MKYIIAYRSKFGLTGTFISKAMRKDTKWLKQGGYTFTTIKCNATKPTIR